jgi:hypothetical protein
MSSDDVKPRREAACAGGKCIRCLRIPVQGYVQCRRCLDKLREKRLRRKASGVCSSCSNLVEPGYVCCKSCNRKCIKAALSRMRARLRARVCVRCAGKRDIVDTMCSVCREIIRRRARQRNRTFRANLLARYGNVCRCCRERTFEFLTIDHVENDGHIERRRLAPSAFYRRLFANPVDRRRYQILCWNCNLAKAHYGTCPHQAAVAQVRPA